MQEQLFWIVEHSRLQQILKQLKTMARASQSQLSVLERNLTGLEWVALLKTLHHLLNLALLKGHPHPQQKLQILVVEDQSQAFISIVRKNP